MALDLRLEIVVDRVRPLASYSHTLIPCVTKFGTNVIWEVNRHTVRHTDPVAMSCSFGWCLAKGHVESEISAATVCQALNDFALL